MKKTSRFVKIKIFLGVICLLVSVICLLGYNSKAYYYFDEIRDISSGVNEICSVDNLPFGVYNVDIKYDTNYENEKEPATELYIEGSIDTSNIIVCDNTKLHKYRNTDKMRIWVKAFKGSGKITLFSNTVADNCTTIENVTIYEYRQWRYGVLLAVAALLVVFNFLTTYVKNASEKGKIQLLIILIIVGFSSIPALIGNKGIFFGHDIEFHINRIVSIVNEISMGNFPSFYQHNAQNGAGYIALIMYGKILLYIPALLYTLGFSIAFCYNFYIVLINLITCLLAIYSFRGIFKSDRYAYLGMVIYMLAPYRIMDIYIRGAVGEYSAMAFLPLVLYGLYRIYFIEESNLNKIVPLIIGLTGIIQTHVLTMEMVAIFAFVFALVHLKKTISCLKYLTQVVVLTLLINLFFIVPFISQYKQELFINNHHIPTSDLTTTGVFIPQLLDMFMISNGANVYDSCYNEMPLSIGVVFLLGLLLFSIIIVCKQDVIQSEYENKVFILVREISIYGILALWLSTNLFPWKEFHNSYNSVIRIITSVQYVWRYLSLATLFLTIVTVYSIKVISEQKDVSNKSIPCSIMYKYSKHAVFVFVFLTFVVIGSFFTEYINSVRIIDYHYIGNSTHSDWIYLPYGATDTEIVDVKTDPETDVVVESAEFKSNGDRVFRICNLDEECDVTLPMFYYKHIKVFDKNNHEVEIFPGYNSQITMHCPKNYDDVVTVSFYISKYWYIAYMISAISIIVLFVYSIRIRYIRL